ncbi:EAL domain-containing protein [Neptunicella sp. SCSIO 80796]|uniref:EAL domain-containing protein n=1 Tax=Neptunicella plasticusilytica TaxID=3117012 RepID=UPI003A4E0729
MHNQSVTNKNLKVLIIEDMPDDALILADYLQDNGYPIDWQRVSCENDLKNALQQPWQLVLSDFTMPGFGGLQALEIVRQQDQDIPFIFVSGSMGEDHAVEAIRSGAQDFIIKGQLLRLLPAIERELRDVEFKRTQRQTRQLVKQLSMAVEQTADSVMIIDAEKKIEYVNAAFEQQTGYGQQELLGQPDTVLFTDSQQLQFQQQIWNTVEQGEVYIGTVLHPRKHGEHFYQERIITPLKNDEGVITHYIATGRDITQRLKAEEARNQLATILEASPDFVTMMSPKGTLTYLNSSGRELVGIALQEELKDKHITDLFPRQIAQSLIAKTISVVNKYGAWTGETMMINSRRANTPVSIVMLAHRDKAGQVQYLSMIARDISERKHFEEEIQYHNTHDALTGLPNRILLLNQAPKVFNKSDSLNKCTAIFSLGLDNFKRVNDSLGHAEGDDLLQQIANKLTHCLWPNDIVARQGGDEFTLLASELNQAEDALKILKKIQQTFKQPMRIGHHEFYITFSTGIAVYPNDGNKIDDLLRNADTAMHQAKASGAGQYRFYEAQMNARSHEILKLEADLQRALDNNEFTLHYQPQVDIEKNKIIGVEALIRWQHPQRGLVSPADFIEWLETSRLIIPVGEWVIQQACLLHRRFRELGYKDMRISVNVSSVQFGESKFLRRVQNALDQLQMPKNMLELEITENIVMQDPDSTTELLVALKKMGVRIAIDDFGTGYSSMSYLKKFPVDVLKIDQTFIRDLDEISNDAAIVEASIYLADKIGLETIAEGVETVEQLGFLQNNGCHIIQGYYFSKPLPEQELLTLLNNGIKYQT